jgi:hypothetical protein
LSSFVYAIVRLGPKSRALRLIVTKPTQQNAGGFGVGVPFLYAGGVAELGEPFEQADESLTLVPIPLAECIPQILSSRLA